MLNGTVGSVEAVISQDPSFAPAYADLAPAHVMRSGQFQFDIADELLKIRAAQKAIELDPLLAEAQDAAAFARSRDAQWEESEKSFRRAIELDPNCAMTTVTSQRLAEKADPLSYEVHFHATYVLFAAGRYKRPTATATSCLRTLRIRVGVS